MKTLPKNQPQLINSEYCDRQICEDDLESNEPKDHLHQNYRHWAWLPKPK